MKQRLQETTLSESPLAVDREVGVIKGVKILGRESKNGRTYSARALSEAAKYYEGIKVNIDHPDRSNPNQERSFTSFIGQLESCHVAESGDVFGDLNILKSSGQSESVFEAAERFPKQFGLSHNAEGELVQKDGSWVVESIDCVHSVDIVSQPATNAGLFESVELPKMKKTLREVVKSASKKRKGFKRILEQMDEEGMLAEVADEEVIDAEVSAADAAVEALAKRANEIFKDPKIPPKEVGKKAAELAQMAEDVKEKLDTIEETVSGESSDGAGGSEEESALPESVQKRLRSIDRMEAKNMLLESGREASKERITAVAAVPEAQRQKLVESWPEKSNGKQTARPGKSPSIMESEEREWKPSADSKEFASRLRKV
jgi:hypothetical protein